MIVPVRPGEFGLLRRTDRADCRRAEMLRPLAGDKPDTTCGSVEEDGIARLHVERASKQILGRHALEHHGRSLFVVDPVRNLHDLVGRYEARLRVGAERGRAVGDAVPCRETRDACADFSTIPAASLPGVNGRAGAG